jgi:hypothetical protein
MYFQLHSAINPKGAFMDFTSAAAYNPNQDPQRPYVQFEMRPTEDRTTAKADGVCQLVDVPWAIVRAAGSKDSLEKTADAWLSQLATYAKDGRVPPSWPSDYRNAFELWKKGEEIPLNGTPIKTWPPLSPSQRKNILAAGILTVEDLARANDETLAKIGMGAHSVTQMAQKWLLEAKDQGATSKALADAMVLVESLKETVQNQVEQLRELKAEFAKKPTAAVAGKP